MTPHIALLSLTLSSIALGWFLASLWWQRRRDRQVREAHVAGWRAGRAVRRGGHSRNRRMRAAEQLIALHGRWSYPASLVARANAKHGVR